MALDYPLLTESAPYQLPVAPEGLAPARFLGDSESPGSSPLMPMTPMTSGSASPSTSAIAYVMRGADIASGGPRSQSPVREGWTPLGVMHRPSTRKLIYSPMRQGKEMKEVARLKPGQALTMLCAPRQQTQRLTRGCRVSRRHGVRTGVVGREVQHRYACGDGEFVGSRRSALACAMAMLGSDLGLWIVPLPGC